MGSMRGLVLSSAPAAEPVSLVAAKAHLRVEISDDDDLITSLIQSSREYCESWLSQALVTQTWVLTMDAFPAGEILVPKPPLQSVSQIRYYATDGTLTTLSSSRYDVVTSCRPGRIAPSYGYLWPKVRSRIGAVEVTFVAGYGGASDVPASIKQAILLLVAHLYANREQTTQGALSDLPMGVAELLMTHWIGEY